jgi:hypothetical protein
MIPGAPERPLDASQPNCGRSGRIPSVCWGVFLKTRPMVFALSPFPKGNKKEN